MSDPDNFDQWIVKHPPPDLQELVAAFGSYAAITPAAWALHDQRMRRWQLERIDRLLKRTNKQPPNFAKKI